MVDRKRILVAPLDWGLGHATRCIPIIKELLRQGHEVVIAAEGPVKILLEKEFPIIEFISLKGYRIKYGKTKRGFLLSVITQIPKLFISIKKERDWLKKTIEQNKIDIVISDNRFGLWNKKIYSIFITHQLQIKSPFLKRGLQKLNYLFINQYNECWVPDIREKPGLAGDLSHPDKLPSVPIHYIGCLSRFQRQVSILPEKHLLILLSGPEPQRTLLEKKLLLQLKHFPNRVLFIRGLPHENTVLNIGQQATCINHLTAGELQLAIREASFVVARSGYSTVMDLMKLQKKSILIPTPGQTEQEYLAKHLMEQHFAFTVNQKDFDLENALSAAQLFPYVFPDLDENNNQLQRVISFMRLAPHLHP